MNSVRALDILERQIDGASRNQIAADLGIHPTRVWQITQTEEYKKIYESLTKSIVEDVKMKFLTRSGEAGDRIFALMKQDQNLRVSLTAAQDLLDRGGFKPKTEVENVITVRLERKRIDLISETARELGAGYIEGVATHLSEEEPLLLDESDPGQGQADEPASLGDVQLHPGRGTEDLDASTAGSLQNNNRVGGLSDLAPHPGPE